MRDYECNLYHTIRDSLAMVKIVHRIENWYSKEIIGAKVNNIPVGKAVLVHSGLAKGII